MKEICIIRFSSLGDLVLLTPLIRETKKLFPEANIDLLTSDEFAPLFAGNPHLRRVISWDRKGQYKEELLKLQALGGLRPYDLIFDAHRSLRSRTLLWNQLGWNNFFGSQVHSINKRSLRRNFLLYSKKKFFRRFISQREAYCQILSPWKNTNELDLSTELFPGSKEQTKVQQIYEQYDLPVGRVIALSPGASFEKKCWPKESFVTLVQELQKKGVSLALLGGAGEENGTWLHRQIKGKAKPCLLTGKLSYLESAAFLDSCRLLIGNDTASIHLAEAMGTPAISLFGPTVKEFGYSPFLPNSHRMEASLFCRPCSRNGSGPCFHTEYKKCLKLITPEQVLSEAWRIYRGT